MPLEPIEKRTAADAIFDQLAGRIVSGQFEAGTTLPAERNLSEQLGVSRPAVREALQRLAQMGLVDIRHGDGTTVTDYRLSAGLDILPRLVFRQDGSVDAIVVRSVLELRVAVAADAARRCAERAGRETLNRLESILVKMRAAKDDLSATADLDYDFWSVIVDGSANVAYRLAFNAQMATYRPVKHLLETVLAEELQNFDGHRALVAAITQGNSDTAYSVARDLLESSSRPWNETLRYLDQVKDMPRPA